jgi:tetratricopeptide (TPR) repeat protein
LGLIVTWVVIKNNEREMNQDNSSTPEAAAHFSLTRDRDAYATIRGFFFQVERTVQRWLQLADGQSLEVERGEDIDIVAGALVDNVWQEERVLEQLKSWEKNITLVGGREAVANFHEHRTANSDLNLRFCLTTNAHVTTERPPLFAEQEKNKKAGIEWWRDVATDRLDEMARTGVLMRIRQRLGACEAPENFNLQTWQAFQEFARNGSEDAWLDFIKRFEWMTGITSPLELSREVQEELLRIGSAKDEAVARSQYERLFVFVLRLLSQPGLKRLEANGWKKIVETDLPDEDRTLLASAFSRLEAVEQQLDTLNERLTGVEDQVEVLTTNQSGLELRVSSVEGQVQQVQFSQSTLLTNVKTGQDLTQEQLGGIQGLLSEMRRTRTEEELRNSPEAQVLKAEVQVEEARNLVEEGKVRTAQKRLEQLRSIVLSLEDKDAQKRLESRVCGLIAFCRWRQGDVREANELFRQAYALQPTNAKTAANAAYGALLVNQPEEGLRLGYKALDIDPANDDALSMVVRSLHLLQRGDEIGPVLQKYSSAASGLQTLFTRGGITIENGDYQTAQDFALQVLDLAPMNPLAHRLNCDALYVSIQLQLLSDAPLLMRLSPEQHTQLEKAETAATRALELMDGWESIDPICEVYTARVGIREMLGKIDEAVADCEEILKLSPESETAHFMKGEILLHFRRDPSTAVTHLKQVKTGKLGEDARILQAEALVDLKEWSQVLEVLEPIYSPDSSRREQMDLARLLLQAAYFGNDAPRVEQIKEDLETHYSGESVALATLADLARWQGDTDRALELLHQALERDQSPRRERLLFWMALTQQTRGEYSASAATLESIVDIDQPDLLLRTYLEVLVQAGQEDRAAEIARNVRNKGRAIPGISEYEANGANNNKDYELASLLFEQMSEDNPSNPVYARHVAALLLHDLPPALTPEVVQADPTLPDRIERARTALGRITFDLVKHDAALMMEISFLRLQAGFSDAPEWAYRALRLSPGNGATGAAYIKFILSVNGDGPRFDVEEVKAESAVVIKPVASQDKENNRTWIITNHLTGGTQEISPDSALAQKLLGKRAGDRFEVESIPVAGNQEWEIVSVKSKYIHAHHEIFQLFAGGLISHHSMAVMRVSTPGEQAQQERQQLRRFLDEGQSIEELYDRYALPVSCLAQLTGRIIPDLWRSDYEHGGYTVEKEGRFRAADGSDAEMLQHRQIAFKTNALVLDWTALISAVHTNAEEALSSRYERLVVPRLLEEEAAAYAGRHGVVALLNENDGARRKREFAQRLMRFVREKCEVVDTNDWSATDEEVSKTYGRSTIAAIRIAGQQSLPLWSDDIRTRRFAHERYNQLRSVGVQWLLLALRAGGHLDNQGYSERVRILIYAGYAIVWVTIPFTMWLFRRNEMNVTDDVHRVLSVLSYWEIKEPFAVSLAAGVLVALRKESLLEHRLSALEDAVLDALTQGRATFPVIQSLREQLDEILNLDRVTFYSILQSIQLWSRRHIQIVRSGEIIQPHTPLILPN